MASRSGFDTLPTELVHRILSYLTHPRSRLPGRTERLSSHDCPDSEKRTAQVAYHDDFTAPPDTDRWVTNIFSIYQVQHPFNEVALTSRRMRDHVESFCKHLVKTNNIFNLPFSLIESNGADHVYPDMSSIIYRRLWLQYAPRLCIYCSRTVTVYPRHHPSAGRLTGCEQCFLAQALEWGEVVDYFHLQKKDMLVYGIRGTTDFSWVLRSDIENLALRRWGVKRFHAKHEKIHTTHDNMKYQAEERCRICGNTHDYMKYQVGEQCHICGIVVKEEKDRKEQRRKGRRHRESTRSVSSRASRY